MLMGIVDKQDTDTLSKTSELMTFVTVTNEFFLNISEKTVLFFNNLHLLSQYFDNLKI